MDSMPLYLQENRETCRSPALQPSANKWGLWAMAVLKTYLVGHEAGPKRPMVARPRDHTHPSNNDNNGVFTQ